MQVSFNRLWDGFETDKEAKAARDLFYRKVREAGFRVKRFVLKNQLKPYNGLGSPCGVSCSSFYADVDLSDRDDRFRFAEIIGPWRPEPGESPDAAIKRLEDYRNQREV